MGVANPNFFVRLRRGQQTENELAEHLRNEGVLVEQPQMEPGAATSEYTKRQIDLIGNGYVLEVKGRNFRFTSVADYPYPTIFVESTDGFDRKIRTPDFYVNVSNDTGGTIALDVAATRHLWTTGDVTDRSRNQTYPMYIAETKLWMDWNDFVGRLKA